MIVAGVMSGTSADGIDVALVQIKGRGIHCRLELLAHHHAPYPRKVRQYVLASMNAVASVAELSRLNFLLGELYAVAVRETLQKSGFECELVGCHGQTIYHQGNAMLFLGRDISCTWQIGDGSVLAARLGVPVVSDFRPADMAAGGKGAPLVPYLDYVLFRHERWGRIVQNIGGIANLTAIPPAAGIDDITAFDTGPGNMVIDAVAQRLFNRPFDRNGRLAAHGKPLGPVERDLLRQPFFHQPPPRTAGREEFGREFVSAFLRRCGKANKHDVIATATALTAQSIGHALRRFVIRTHATQGRSTRSEPQTFREFIVSGGGTKNQTLMGMISAELADLNLRLRTTDKIGIPSEAKKAVAFALLAYQTWHRLPSNVPSATGAKRPVILGKISYA